MHLILVTLLFIPVDASFMNMLIFLYLILEIRRESKYLQRSDGQCKRAVQDCWLERCQWLVFVQT